MVTDDHTPGRLVRLTNGQEVPFDQALQVMLPLLTHRCASVGIGDGGERLIAALKAMAEGSAPPDNGEAQRERRAQFCTEDGRIQPLVAAVVLSAVGWRNDHLELSCPFAEAGDRQQYESQCQRWVQEGRLPEWAFDERAYRNPENRLDYDLQAARERDFATGDLTLLTSGVRVPTATAVYLLWDLTLPDLDTEELDEQRLTKLVKFCRGERIPRDLIEAYKDSGKAAPDGTPDPVLRAVVTASFRWDAAGKLVVVSPFTDPAAQREYEQMCQEHGDFAPTTAPAPDANLSSTPPWPRRGSGGGSGLPGH